MKTARRGAVRTALGGIAIGALMVGCAAAPDASAPNVAGGATSDFLPCMAASSTGFDDGMFNEQAKAGLDEAAAELGVTSKGVEAKQETDYANNIQSLITEGCDLIVAAGFDFAEVMHAAATNNPDIDFLIIDDAADADGDGEPDLPNLKPMLFDTAQVMFLAGYAAADYSETGVVGLFGAIPIPPITIFMDGVALGVEHYNEVHDADVALLGWDFEKQEGVFTGGFEANETAKTTTKNLIDQGADVIVPIATQAYISAAEAIADSGQEVALIGGDGDMFYNAPEYGHLWFVSAEKLTGAAVKDVVLQAAAGEFDNSTYIGDLTNDAVGLTPFHEYEERIDATLPARLDELKAQIVSGEITVDSPASPRK